MIGATYVFIVPVFSHIVPIYPGWPHTNRPSLVITYIICQFDHREIAIRSLLTYHRCQGLLIFSPPTYRASHWSLQGWSHDLCFLRWNPLQSSRKNSGPSWDSWDPGTGSRVGWKSLATNRTLETNRIWVRGICWVKIKKISGIENNHENQRMKSNHETKIDFLALSILRYQNHDRRVGFQGGNSSSGSCTSLHIRWY